MNKRLFPNLQHLLIFAIFLVLCFAYFTPAIQGKVLYQSDVMEAKAQAKEILEIKDQTGTGPLWTNAMYGGMPSFQIWAQYPGNITTYVISLLKTVFPDPVDIIFCFLFGSYFLLWVLRVKPWLAAAGAVAFTFSSYNFIYIMAGHSNHVLAMAFFAPILASILYTLRGGKYLLPGALLTAFFIALEIRTNHIQMTYYLFIAILIFVLIELYHAYANKELKPFLNKLAYLFAAVLLAVAINAGSLWSTWQYGQQSIRGKSNLTTASKANDTGLDRDYAYEYSQGVGEMGTLFVPNLYGGGSSNRFPNEESEVAKGLVKNGVPREQVQPLINEINQMTQNAISRPYWGNKPYTAGPWYFGAIVLFLFIVGLFIIESRFKWWIVSTSFLFIFLSFGRNFPLVSDLFFDYFPLYNKFRSVDFTLGIPAFLFPILAFLAFKELSEQKDHRKDLNKKLWQSFALTAGLLVLFLLLPTLFFSFRAPYHEALVGQLTQAFEGNATIANAIGEGLIADRISIAKADALRSLIFIVIGFGVTWFMLKSKIKSETAAMILGVAILADMWAVDRRYLNDKNFYEPTELAQTVQPTSADEKIMADPALDFRVLDLTKRDPFFDAEPSNFHKSVGGRHSARLQRFDELITKQFDGKLNQSVLDMLNTKYFIVSDTTSPVPQVIQRPGALGNAWFVQNLKFVKTADQEMSAINSFDPKNTAVVHESFKSLTGNIDQTDTTASIELKSYHPDHLTYQYKSKVDAVAVFAEIWYDKGWNAYLDGNKIPYFRANYVLRAAKLPAGAHRLEFKFEPASYLVGDKISLAASILLVGAVGLLLYKRFRKPETA